MEDSLWIGVIIIALYIWGETYSCIKANRQNKRLVEMRRQKPLGSEQRHIDLRE
jgi:hypothetical protein